MESCEAAAANAILNVKVPPFVVFFERGARKHARNLNVNVNAINDIYDDNLN